LIGKSNPTMQILSLRRRSTFLREKLSEPEVADTMGTNQSSINCRKQATLKGLRMKLREREEFKGFA
jgi:hypothetical protein